MGRVCMTPATEEVVATGASEAPLVQVCHILGKPLPGMRRASYNQRVSLVFIAAAIASTLIRFRCFTQLPSQQTLLPRVVSTSLVQGVDATQDRHQRAFGVQMHASSLTVSASNTRDSVLEELKGKKMRLTASIFGFPGFRSIVEFRADGSAHFSAGMVAKQAGGWNLENGDPDEGESEDDLYVQFTQPLTEKYIDMFTVPGGTCFWRGKIDVRGGSKKRRIAVEGGVVVSEREENLGKVNLVKEGTFTAIQVDDDMANDVRKRNVEAFERALKAPKGESSGFKTPARIAGARGYNKKKQLAKQEEAAKQLEGGEEKEEEKTG